MAWGISIGQQYHTSLCFVSYTLLLVSMHTSTSTSTASTRTCCVSAYAAACCRFVHARHLRIRALLVMPGAERGGSHASAVPRLPHVVLLRCASAAAASAPPLSESACPEKPPARARLRSPAPHAARPGRAQAQSPCCHRSTHRSRPARRMPPRRPNQAVAAPGISSAPATTVGPLHCRTCCLHWAAHAAPRRRA